ncbi:MAG TPA: hypothetical protein GXZ65_04230 [Clostridiales bacterium]|jgi:hypothetical protein|nr:hypothetical protein [Clostridiales bacterium]
MDNNLENIARSMLKSMGGEKLSEKMSELNKLAESKDAQNLKQKLGDGSEILKAAQKGDSQTLQCLLSSILQTEEGARIARTISDMLK